MSPQPRRDQELDARVAVRVRPELAAQVERIARKRGQSLADVLRRALALGLAALEAAADTPQR
jgi:predicted transcriptional regulator